MTIKEAKQQLREVGITLRTCPVTGEYEVKPFGCRIDSRKVYHTDDLSDAIDMGFQIANCENMTTFRALQRAADEHRYATGGNDPELVLTSAMQNADDTLDGNCRNPQYWGVALRSIQCSIEANCLEDKLFPWFKQHGFTI